MATQNSVTVYFFDKRSNDNYPQSINFFTKEEFLEQMESAIEECHFGKFYFEIDGTIESEDLLGDYAVDYIGSTFSPAEVYSSHYDAYLDAISIDFKPANSDAASCAARVCALTGRVFPANLDYFHEPLVKEEIEKVKVKVEDRKRYVDLFSEKHRSYLNRLVVVWYPMDVQSIDESLSEEEAIKVLNYVRKNYDANVGINNEVIESVIESGEWK